ncbi:MAG: GNAT family N-acetyltransferase [Planctomycetota bacterium]|nr:GNAT family N-acetyltransferase [Planctomycetota bacterium]
MVEPPPGVGRPRAGQEDLDSERDGMQSRRSAPHRRGPRDGALEVRAGRPDDDAARDAFVAAQPEGGFAQRAGWLRAGERVFGHRRRDLVAWRDGRIVGVLPLARCERLLGPAHLISVPYGVCAGPLGEDELVVRVLVAAAVELARVERVGRLELRCDADPGLDDLATSDLYVAFARDLPAAGEDILTGLPKEERRLVRRARDRHGLELVEGAEHITDLERLFHDSKRRLGSPSLPLAWFQTLHEELGGAAVVHATRRVGITVAASLSFVHGDTISMYYVGTTPEANRAWAATSFMIAGLAEWARERGLSRFDLGRSRRDSGALAFKRNQGFEARPLAYRYHLVRSRTTPSFTPSNPRTRILREVWARLPRAVTHGLSPAAARYLP